MTQVFFFFLLDFNLSLNRINYCLSSFKLAFLMFSPHQEVFTSLMEGEFQLSLVEEDISMLFQS